MRPSGKGHTGGRGAAKKGGARATRGRAPRVQSMKARQKQGIKQAKAIEHSWAAVMLRTFCRLKRTAPPPLEFPRLALYRSILRAHQRYLPPDARALGDAYVKEEFALHKDASDNFMVQFDRQWRDYLTTLRATDAEAPIGREMTAEEVAALSDEQKIQLLKIRESASGAPTVDTS